MDHPVPYFGRGFPDGWTPRVRAVVAAVAAGEPFAAVAAAECEPGDVANLAGLLVAALSALGPLDALPQVMLAAARADP